MKLTYRALEARATFSETTPDNVIEGVAIPFERWQRVADSGQRVNAISGSAGTREKIVVDAIRVPNLVNELDDLFIKMLANHDQTQYLGSTRSGALKLFKTASSLNFRLALPGTTLAKDIKAMIVAEKALPVSVGFVERGPRSNVKTKRMTDTSEAGIKELDAEPLPTQSGRLNGSDWVQGTDPETGRTWRVYKSLDVREISILSGPDPAWSGTHAVIGDTPADILPDDSIRSRQRRMLDFYKRIY